MMRRAILEGITLGDHYRDRVHEEHEGVAVSVEVRLTGSSRVCLEFPKDSGETGTRWLDVDRVHRFRSATGQPGEPERLEVRRLFDVPTFVSDLRQVLSATAGGDLLASRIEELLGSYGWPV